MALPPTVRDQIEPALKELRLGTRVVEVVPTMGGSINTAARIVTEGGRTCFLKWHMTAGPDMFEAEIDGLRALRATNQLRVPAPFAFGGTGPTWILMDFVPRGRPALDYDERLGTGLAGIHCSGVSSTWGWSRDNYIGSLPQPNAEDASWAAFWRDRRIAPQLARARSDGLLTEDVMDRLVELIPSALADVPASGLLHGDLWNGNVYPGPTGEPVLIDPAVYRGHGEVDLAMTELFGGFGARFYAAYDESVGIPPEYGAFRRDLYQLYYLLVHVNLFSGSYLHASLSAARRVVAELG